MLEFDVVVRPRTRVECVSLGFLLGKRYFLPLGLTALLGGVVPCVVALAVGFWWQRWLLALVVFVWLRVLVEAPVGLVLARLSAGERWSWRLIGQAYWQGWYGGLWAELFWRRFSVGGRYVRFAVGCLEGLSGEAREKRLAFLQRWHGQVPFSTVWGLAWLENVLFVAVLLIVNGFVDWVFVREFFLLIREPVVGFWLIGLLVGVLAAVSCVMSVFFVCIGFVFYLNQRIVSEGWAVALDLQALARRLLVVLLVAVVGLGGAPLVQAQERESDAQFLQGLVDDAQLSPLMVKKSPIYEREKRDGEVLAGYEGWLKNNRWRGVDGLRVLIVLALVGLGVLAVWAVRRFRWQRVAVAPLAVEGAGGLVRVLASESLDRGAVERLLAQGQYVAALAVLYRLAIVSVRAEVAVADAPSVCVEKVRLCDEQAVVGFFSDLSVLWVAVAFAGQGVEREAVEALWRRFQQLWGAL